MGRDAEGVRPRAYRLLSRLYLRGISAGDLPLLADVPDLAPHLPEPFEPDEAAAEHQRLLQREVLPYASVFLEADGSLGGDVSASVGRRFDAAGLERPASEPPDHVGRELELLAALAERPDGDPAEGGGGTLDLIEGHVLWWVPALVPALRRNADAFWGTAARLTLALVVDHRAALADDAAPHRAPPWNLQGIPRDPLDDPTVDLREVATFLMLPSRSGLYLSEADARSLGRSDRLPGGFGSRARVLETVFHSAVAYDAMPDVAEALHRVVDEVGRALGAMEDDGLPAGFAEPWLRRLEQTEAVLERMRAGQGPVA